MRIRKDEILYSQTWDDFDIIKKGLCLGMTNKKDSFLTICSAGDTAFNALIENIPKVYAIDYNPNQTFLAEIKKAAIKNLTYEEFISLMGITQGNRNRIYDQLRTSLPKKTMDYWDKNRGKITKGLLYCGSSEKKLGIIRKLMQIIYSKRRMHKLAYCNNLDEQKRYYKKIEGNFFWKFINNMMMTKKFNSLMGFYHKRYRAVKENLLKEHQNNLKILFYNCRMKSNYFMSQILLGKFLSNHCVPPYLQEKNFKKMKKNIGGLEIINSSLNKFLVKNKDKSIGCTYASDALEWLSKDEYNGFFHEIIRCSKHNSRIMILDCLVSTKIPKKLRSCFIYQKALSDELLKKNKVPLYKKIKVYHINKEIHDKKDKNKDNK